MVFLGLRRRAQSSPAAIALFVCLLLTTSVPISAHDFGGPTGPAPPPGPPPPCPGCCGGGGGDPCSGGPGCGRSGNPVNFWDGSEQLSTIDVKLLGYFPIDFTRTYDSSVPYDSALGYGWSHTYDFRVFRYPDNSVVLRRPCGARRIFTLSGGAYVSPAGEFRNTLTDNGDGTLSLFESTGNELHFDVQGRLDRWTNVYGARLEFTYDPGGRLPLQGTSKLSPNPNTPGTVALEYRLTAVKEKDVNGTLTGRQLSFTYDANSGRLKSVSDNFGRAWNYSQDARGNLVGVTGPLGLSYTYGYGDANDPHNLTSVNEGALQFTLTYDASDRVTQQSYGAGTVYNIAYTIANAKTDVTKIVKDNLGATLRTEVTSYLFNSFGNPTSITDALGNVFSYSRDAQGNTSTRTIQENRSGTLVTILTDTFTYDASGNPTQEVLTQASTGESITKTYTYDKNTPITYRAYSSLDPTFVVGWNRTYGHNAKGYPTNMLTESKIVSGGSTPSPTFYTMTFAYNAFGQPTSLTYPNNDAETYTYNGAFVATTSGETYTHDARGNLLTRKDRNNNVTTYTYDLLDRVLTITDPANVVTTHTISSNGYITQTEIGRVGSTPGVLLLYGRDAFGRVTSLARQTSGGNVTVLSLLLDSEGRTIQTTDADGRVSKKTYDLLDRVASYTSPLNLTSTYQYDALGNMTKVTDPASRVTTYSFWLFTQPGRPLTITDARGKVWTAVLDPAGNLKTLTDPLNNTLTETHDAMGRLTGFKTPGNAQTSYAMNTRGLVGSRTDAANKVTSFTYNSHGALTGISYPNGDTVTLTLDAGDRVTRATDSDSDISYTYDARDRLIQEKNNTTLRTVNFTYDSYGRRATLSTSDGVSLTYNYDQLDRLTSVVRNGVTEVTYVRDNTGNPSTMTFGNGNVTTYTRDAAGGLSVQETKDSANNVLYHVDYTRDPGRVVTVKHEKTRRPDTTYAESFHHYTFDNARRLTREEIRAADDTTITSARNFTYDDVGNRLTVTPDGGTATTYAYGTDYRLTSETTGASVINYTYTARGELLTETSGAQTTTYGYDPEGRLTSLTSPSYTATYTLAWDGRRLSKTVNGSKTDYLYDGLNAIGEYPASASAISYLSGQNVDEWLMRVQGATKSYYTQLEDLRSILQLTNSTGGVVDHYVYKGFGELIESVVNTPNTYTFTGRNKDDENQHYYFRERLYSSRSGRFLSLDPFRPDSSRTTRMGGTDRLALASSGVQRTPLFEQRRDVNVTGMDVSGYVYVGNNPVNATDPTGEILLWNPASASVTSGCIASGCGISGCGGSGCLASGCGGSGCIGSGCLGSGCGGSVCGGSLCGGSGCAGSACAGSACGASACGGSACTLSGCVGSACGGSACGGSLCIGSACMLSGCVGSACIDSVCGGTGCVGSVCYNSTCGGSACTLSTCGISACSASGCGSSGGCSSSGCEGSACNRASGCNSPCCK